MREKDGSEERGGGSEGHKIDVKRKNALSISFHQPHSITTAIPGWPSSSPSTYLPPLGECRVNREAALDRPEGIHLELQMQLTKVGEDYCLHIPIIHKENFGLKNGNNNSLI